MHRRAHLPLQGRHHTVKFFERTKDNKPRFPIFKGVRAPTSEHCIRELKCNRDIEPASASAAVEQVHERATQAPAPCAFVVPRALVAHKLEAPVAHAQPVLQDARGFAMLRMHDARARA